MGAVPEGRYEILRPIGAGGMAELFLARVRGERGAAGLVVVKRILPHLARDPAFVQMFLNEARIASTLAHPNLVTITDFGQMDGAYFLAMEYVHGADLGELLETAAEVEDLPLDVALTIVHGACVGLHHVHEKVGPDGLPLRLVHRDVSPSNVMVGYDGSVKVTDFGIATATALTRTTRAGTVKGKVSYMSPEQCTGGRLDRRADVFALGIILYEVTLLRRLFVGDNDYALMNQVIEGRVPPPHRVVPGYPPRLEAIVMRALARDADHRFDSAAQLQAAIERFAHEQGIVLSPLAVAQWVERRLGPRVAPVAEAPRPPVAAGSVMPRWAIGIAAVILVLGVAGMGWALSEGPRTVPPAAAEPRTDSADAPGVVVVPTPVPIATERVDAPEAQPEPEPEPDPGDDELVLVDEQDAATDDAGDGAAPDSADAPRRRPDRRRRPRVAKPDYDLDDVDPPR
jgi:hypothetical protein